MKRAWLFRAVDVATLLVLLVAGFNLFFRLGSERVRDFDEARHGVNAYEMLRSGDLVVTTYAGEPDLWNLKPPLGAWIITASYALLGAGILGLRTPSAVAGLAIILLTLWLGRRWFGARAGVLAGAMLATALPFLVTHGGRTGDYDTFFTLAVLVGIASLADLAERRGAVLVLGAALAAAFLLKGFAAGILVAIAAVTLAVRRDVWRTALPRAALACLVASVPVGAWVALRYARDGLRFLALMVTQDILARSSGAIEGASSGWLDHPGYLLDRMAPWSEIVLVCGLVCVVPRAIRRRARAADAGGPASEPGEAGEPTRRSEHVALLACAILVPLVLFSLARTHRPWYMNPVLPPIALLAAHVLDTGLGSPRRALRVGAALLLAAGLLLGEGRVARYLVRHAPMPEGQTFLAGLDAYRGRHVAPSGELAQAERFLLVVVSGLIVDETRAPPGLLLLHEGEPIPADAVVVKQGGGYQLAAYH